MNELLPCPFCGHDQHERVEVGFIHYCFSEDLKRVATNSCANEEDGSMVAKALSRVGTDGLITLEMNQIGTTELTFTNGVKLSATMASPYFNVKKLTLCSEKATDEVSSKSFHSVICTDGSAEIVTSDESYHIKKGESYFLPAGLGKYDILSRSGVSLIISEMA